MKEMKGVKAMKKESQQIPFMIFIAFKTFMSSFFECSSAIEQPYSAFERLLRQA